MRRSETLAEAPCRLLGERTDQLQGGEELGVPDAPLATDLLEPRTGGAAASGGWGRGRQRDENFLQNIMVCVSPMLLT